MSTVDRQRGVTLLEVLIALVILAMIAVIGLEAFRLASRAWERGERRADVEQRVRALQGILARDLGALQPVTVLVDGKRLVDFVGGSDRVTFHSAPVAYRPWPYGAMVRRLTYFVERGAGLVVREAYPLAERASATRPLDRGVVGISFRYLTPPEPGQSAAKWVDTWEPREVGAALALASRLSARTVDDSVSTGNLPLAVEITLAVDDEGRTRELTVLVPIHVGRYL